MNLPDRPITILIAALGGEGGGVMADWLMEAATQTGYPAQATSIPGVAQRTGATTYYLEIFPVARNTLDGKEPVLSLTPSPGNVDVMVASELIEAGRELLNGFVSPERTTLIASTHRIYATVEKMQMADGRFDSSRVLEAAGKLAKRSVLFDMRRLAQESGTVINAVLFGAMAGSGVLPLSREACEQAIRRGSRGAEASLRGFAAGYEIAARERPAPAAEPAPGRATDLQEILNLSFERLGDYQGERYVELYRKRMEPFLKSDAKLAAEVARHLALWMAYEDIIRVADLKTRRTRFERVRRETNAKDGEPVVVIDYLKPGIEEVASILPPFLGRRLVARGHTGLRAGGVGAAQDLAHGNAQLVGDGLARQPRPSAARQRGALVGRQRLGSDHDHPAGRERAELHAAAVREVAAVDHQQVRRHAGERRVEAGARPDPGASARRLPCRDRSVPLHAGRDRGPAAGGAPRRSALDRARRGTRRDGAAEPRPNAGERRDISISFRRAERRNSAVVVHRESRAAVIELRPWIA